MRRGSAVPFLAVLAALMVFGTAPARADMNPSDEGLGLYLGSPIGVTYKYWYARTMAVDAGVGVITGDFAFYATHLWHDFTILPKPASWNGQLPFYFGVGARSRLASDANFGARTIVGVAFLHNTKPFELFAEVGPFLRLAPDVGVSIDGGVGFRYYFKALTRDH